MAAYKKRKAEGQETSQFVSAFAARRRLIKDAASPAAADSDMPAPPEGGKSSHHGAPKSKKHLIKNPVPSSDVAFPQSPPPAEREPDTDPLDDLATSKAIEAILAQGNEVAAMSQVPKEAVVQYSSFILNKKNHHRKAGGILELRLDDSERFLVLGNFGIKVLQGEVTIAGGILRPDGSIHWTSCALCHAIPVLRSSEATVLELHPDPGAVNLRQMERISPLFRRLWNDPIPTQGQTKKGGENIHTFDIICTTADTPKKSLIQPLVSPPEWNKKLATFADSSQSKALSIFICGPKSSGKSTFTKMLGNRLLTNRPPPARTTKSGPLIAVLDIDPGQPEYSPAGTISLVAGWSPNLRASFVHPYNIGQESRIIRSHALAAVSPASDPSLYVECVLDLYQTYQKMGFLRSVPLIVNTPGWIQGTGLDILVTLIQKLRPFEVVYMSEDGPMETVEGLQSACAGLFTTLPSQPSEYAIRTAAHLRAMQTMSYFHRLVPEGGKEEDVTGIDWDPKPLTEKAPWTVKYAGDDQGILGVFFYEQQPLRSLVAETINGSVLAAVVIEDVEAFRGLVGQANRGTSPDGDVEMGEAGDSPSHSAAVDSDLILRTDDGIPYFKNPESITLDPRQSECIGLVLIRGIDTAKSTLQVLTSIQEKRLQDARSNGHHIVLVHGKFETPSWAYIEDLYSRSFGEAVEEGMDRTMEVLDDETSGSEPENLDMVADIEDVPWVEVLRGGEKRPVGSRVWRVRRDLGRGNGGD